MSSEVARLSQHSHPTPPRHNAKQPDPAALFLTSEGKLLQGGARADGAEGVPMPHRGLPRAGLGQGYSSGHKGPW